MKVLADEHREFRCVSIEGFDRGLEQVWAFHVLPSDVKARRVGQMA